MIPPVFGITGWKNSGKTTLTARLIAEFTKRGYVVSAIKHAHESFDIDQPGRDSYRLREAGARRVVLSSPKRWALMHELRDEPEMPLDQILAEVGDSDLVLIEGYKREPFPKIEIRRDGGASRQPLAKSSPQIVAIASDRPSEEEDGLPTFHLDDVSAMADFIVQYLRLASA
ncbi:MAG: molybdopterin-guanine dinucleotide biosynthesis protein B [Methyloceanibacter sp.]|jgi:molybdopterin-guanine dinucleotide biosynthesis protein B